MPIQWLNRPAPDDCSERTSHNGPGATQAPGKVWGVVLLLLVLLAPFASILIDPNGRVLGHPQGDCPKAYYPFAHYLGSCWSAGIMPLWNPHIMLGIPFVGEGQASAFHPLTLLFAFLETGAAVNWLVALSFVLGGMAFHGYLRSLGLGRPAAWAGAVTWSFSSVLISRISAGHLNILLTLVSFPLIMMCWERYRAGGGLRHLAGISAAYGLMILAHYPQVLYLFSLFFLVYVLVQSGVAIGHRSSTFQREGKTILALGLFIVLGIGIGAIQLLPAFDFVAQSFRRESTLEYAGTLSFPPENLLTLIAPQFFGTTLELAPGRYWGRNIFWEMWMYIGVLPVLLATAGAWAAPRRLRVALLVCGGLFLVLGLGKHTFLFQFLYEYLPFFDLFRGSSKNTLVTLFCLVTLSAFGFQALFGEAEEPVRRRSRRVAVVAGALLFMVCIAVEYFLLRDATTAGSNLQQLIQWILASREVCMPPLTSDGTKLLQVAADGATSALFRTVILLMLSVALLFLKLPASCRQYAFVLPILFIMTDLLGVFLPMRHTFDKSMAETSLVLEPSAKTVYPPRLLIPSNPMPNLAMQSGYSSVFGYTGNTLKRYNDLISHLQQLDPQESRSESTLVSVGPQLGMLAFDAVVANPTPGADAIGSFGGQPVVPYDSSKAQPRAFLAAAPRYFSNPEEALSYVVTHHGQSRNSPAIERGEPPLPAHPVEADESVRILSFAPNRVEIEAVTRHPRELVLCDMFERNWQAEVNGSPATIAPANYVFRGVQVPAGKSRVVFSYGPTAFQAGAMISAFSLAILLAMAAAWALKHFNQRQRAKISPEIFGALTGQMARKAWRSPVLWTASVVALVTAGVFLPVINAEFVAWDDNLNLYGNPHIQQFTWENVKWMFTDTSLMRRYVPLSWLNWALLVHFFGLKPSVFHAQALALHAANAVLLFWLLLRLRQLANPEPRPVSWPVALVAGVAALLWALHPLRVEVVAWANCQMYAQAFFFALLALLSYLRGVEVAGEKSLLRTPHAWVSTGLFACSLLTYPTMLGFVVVLLMLDVCLLRRLPGNPRQWTEPASLQVFLEKLPLVWVTLGVLAVTLWARANMGGVWTGTSNLENFGWISRLAQAFYIWAYYLWKPWLPFDLSPVYTQLVLFHPSEWPFLLSVLAVVGLTVLFAWQRRRWPILLPVWICHLVLLVPMLGLTEHPHYPNDRYNYMAGALWSVLLGAVFLKLRPSQLTAHGTETSAWGKTRTGLTLASAVIVIGFSGVASIRQIPMWQNSESLFQTIIARLGNDPYRCDAWWRLGTFHATQKRWQKAKECYAEALKIKPDFVSAQIELAGVLFFEGNLDAAAAQYREALRLSPKHPGAHFNLAVVLEKQGRLDEAVRHYSSVLESEPANMDARLALAAGLSKLGRTSEAIDHALAAAQLNPNSAEAHFNAGNALMMQEKVPQALEHFVQAVKLKPVFPEAQYNLGTALAMTGQMDKALEHIEAATAHKPDYTQAQLAHAMALSSLGRFSEAVPRYRTALKLQPDLVPALVNLGWILVTQQDPNLRDPNEAMQLASHAVKLTEERDLQVLDLLMTASAAAGNTDQAQSAARRAIDLANASGQKEAALQLEARLNAYLKGETIVR